MQLPDKHMVPEPEPPKKDIKPVVTGVVPVQRPATRRFLNFVFAESPKDLCKRIGQDVLVPRAKAGVEEALNSFIRGMFWGQGSPPLSNIVQGTVLRGGTNYQALSSGPPSALTQARAANTTRTSGAYEDLVCPTQESAERLLANLFDIFNQYRVVCVADLYELANIKPAPSDNVYGWLSLDGARISKVRNGYLLELPRPSVI